MELDCHTRALEQLACSNPIREEASEQHDQFIRQECVASRLVVLAALLIRWTPVVHLGIIAP
ncbi:hypothetical protein [Pseudofrankia saprophytica]|nr:hypothetical protein [Pseudofrankia saprophytica]OHV40410.1 hypothetical protein BCD49_39575 [Pseudofrankia sp. EUN1h]